MGELETEYGDRIFFNVIPAEKTAQSADDLEMFGFTELKHGMVGFAADGEVLVKIAGHNFGKERIEQVAETVLAD